jgi:ABC-type multidrug transport system fused ATPase/permease subunit
VARYSRNDQAGIELPKAHLDREILRQALHLFRYLGPYRGRFVAALIVLFISSLLSLAFPYLAGSIVDAASSRTEGGSFTTGVTRTALLLLVILAVQAGCSFFHSLSFASVGQRSLVDLRGDVYARLS